MPAIVAIESHQSGVSITPVALALHVETVLLQMATSSDLSRRQQRAGRVTGWPLQPTNAPPLLLGRHDNLTACPWLLNMLIGEAVFLQSCSWILLFPILGLAPASYFLPQDTRAGHLETD